MIIYTNKNILRFGHIYFNYRCRLTCISKNTSNYMYMRFPLDFIAQHNYIICHQTEFKKKLIYLNAFVQEISPYLLNHMYKKLKL